MSKGRLLLVCAIGLIGATLYLVPIIASGVRAPRTIRMSEELSIAENLNDEAIRLMQEGDYATAISLARQALANRQRIFGHNDRGLRRGLNTLARLYYYVDEYRKAELLYKRLIILSEMFTDSEVFVNHRTLHDLAEVCRHLGKHAEAEALYRRALVMAEKALGPENLDAASILNGLAVNQLSIGNYGSAEVACKRSLEIAEKLLGPDHPNVAGSLNTLAGVHCSLGDDAMAEILFNRSLAISEKVYGTEHRDVATILDNLGGIYFSRGDYSKAEQVYKRSLAVWEKTAGQESWDLAMSLNNLARVYHSLGELFKAEALYSKSLAILDKTFGSLHPYVAHVLNNLAELKAETGHFAEAYELLKRVNGIDNRLIEQVTEFTSENERMKFLLTKRDNLLRLISLIVQKFIDKPAARRDALDGWMRRKGLILEAQRRFQESLSRSRDSKVMETWENLNRTRAQISRLIFSQKGDREWGTLKAEIAALESEKEALETKLGQLNQDYATRRRIAGADCEMVAKVLPPGSVLLEFSKVRLFNFEGRDDGGKWLPERYIAFILHSGKPNSVSMVDLGDSDSIDSAIKALKSDIVEVKDRGGELVIPTARRTHDLVFGPILDLMEGERNIFISPDGNLNLIPFEVFQDPKGRFLIEDYTFNYLGAGRDILGFGLSEKGWGKALIMGDPDFDMENEEKESILGRLLPTDAERPRGFGRSVEMRDLNFSRLPGSRQEVKAIHSLFGKYLSEMYLDKNAVEEVLFSKTAPSVLHLATHGFFLSDIQYPSGDGPQPGRGLELVPIKPKSWEQNLFHENPLLRTGIVLAGANVALHFGDAERSDGIVTAEKILGLPLQGTEMVVLSACETGLGEVQTGEGVFGLRRAFAQAGAKSIVMSMWSVPDKETKELMVEFYTNILSGKVNRCQALRQAALKQMSIVKERYGHTNPFYWGAFVFLGEP